MAYIEKRSHKNGKFSYRARVRQAGAPDLSQSFATRSEAIKWSQRMEAEVRAGRYFGREEDREKTFAEFIDRYIEKELPKNPNGYKKQKMMLNWWKSHLGRYLQWNKRGSQDSEKVRNSNVFTGKVFYVIFMHLKKKLE